jgi:hypothetical protein
VHGIVPGGGISLDGQRWVACRPGFFLPVRVLSRLFRRLFCEKLAAAHQAGKLQFFGEHEALEKAEAFAAFLKPLRQIDWVVYAKRPFAGPEAVLAYLSRYPHRLAIANSRLIVFDEKGVTFKWKDYRAKGRCRYGRMTLPVEEFMRRFLLHLLPRGFHGIAIPAPSVQLGRRNAPLTWSARSQSPPRPPGAIPIPIALIPPLPACQTARGFLLQGSSAAYRRPC